MNLRVDELLAGVVNQIRLRESTPHPDPPAPTPLQRSRSPIFFIEKIINRHNSKSCENMMVI
jgi:hypothetical protein